MRRLKTLWLASIVLLLFTACGGDSSNDDGGGNKPTPASSGNSFVMGVKLTRHDVTTVVESDSAKAHTSYINTWGESSKAQIIGKQGDLVEDFGSVTVKSVTENVLGNFEVDLSKSQLNTKNSIDYYGFFSGMKGGVKDGRVYYDASQRRGFAPGYWFKASSNSTTATAQLCGVTEILYITNKTSNQILVTHNGFDTDEKWYYPKALIDVADNSIFETGDGNEVTTTGQFIAPNVMKSIITTYAPTGKAINNAQLICNISGTVVRSVNSISSNIIPQIGHIYAIYATWDGEKLVLGDKAGNSVVEIPEGANISPSEIKVYGDGNEITIDSNGTFSSSASSLVALGKDGKIMHMSCMSVEPEQKENKCILNSMETAVTLLVTILPNVLTIDDDAIFKKIRDNIANLQETKLLADAIDRSIVKNGYFDMNDISVEYNAGYQKIKDLLGLGNINTNSLSRSRTAVTPVYPSVPNFDPNEARMWFILDKDDCEWKHVTEPEEMNVWDCSFTVTSIRFSPMAMLVGHWEDDETGIENGGGGGTSLARKKVVNNLYPLKDETELFENMIPAYSMKTVYDRMTFSPGDYKGIIEHYKMWKYTIKDGRYHAIDEALKEGVKLRFRSEKDGIMILGPWDHPYLQVYNILSSGLCPLIKNLGGEIIKVRKDIDKENGGLITTETFDIFCLTIIKDLIKTKTILSLTDILNSGDPSVSKTKAIAEIIWPVVKDHIKSEINKELGGLSEGLFDAMLKKFGRADAVEKINEVEKILKDDTKWIEMIAKTGDFVFQLGIGSQETGFFLPMNLDFNVPRASLEDIPGENY